MTDFQKLPIRLNLQIFRINHTLTQIQLREKHNQTIYQTNKSSVQKILYRVKIKYVNVKTNSNFFNITSKNYLLQSLIESHKILTANNSSYRGFRNLTNNAY